MSSPCVRTIALVSLTIASTTGFAARGVLRADGVLRLKGVEPTATIITVVPDGAPSYSLPMGTMRFLLMLPLDDIYLISIAGEGCPTKEIYFDTRVPAVNHATDYAFPFMVTLEHLSPERMFVYAGPVGFVRFLDPLIDFGYETEYAVQVDESLRLRSNAFRATGVETKFFVPLLAARVVNRPRGEYSISSGSPAFAGSGTLAPVVSEVALMVHVVKAAISIPATALYSTPVILHTDPEVAMGGSEEESGVSRRAAIDVQVPGAEPLPPVVEERVPDSPFTNLATSIPKGSILVAVWVPERTEELISEPRMVTRIVRFSTPSSGLIEFRKVTHAFGAVYYFQGSRSITERAFEEAIAPVVVGAL